MGLTSSLQIGRSALTASQIGVQVAGDNLANAATPGYHRRVATISPISGVAGASNISLGRGVRVAGVSRTLDLALQARIRGSIAGNQAALVDQSVLSQLESVLNELGDQGLGARLDSFFNAFSELANNPGASESKTLVVEEGASLSQFISRLRTDMTDLRDQIDSQIGTNVQQADELLNQISSLNLTISQSEGGGVKDAALRDQRDSLIGKLSELIDVTVNEQPSGSIDIFIGSTPILLSGQTRGLQTRSQTVNGVVTLDILVSSTLEVVKPQTGTVGGLLGQRAAAVQQSISDLDALSSGLIFEVNKLHSSGRSFPGLTSTTSERGVASADQTVALNDPANMTFSGLPFAPTNGSFTVFVVDQTSGLVTSKEITIDLDGIDNTGAAGFSNDTTLTSLTADLNAVPNLTATTLPNGKLQITAGAGFEFGFGDDSSGALATLGINTYFTGEDARNIGVRQELASDPQRLVTGVSTGSNEAALAIAALRDTPIKALGSVSVNEAFRRTADRIGVSSAAASTRADATGQVRKSLEAQQAAVSGVSIDEETINLLNFQRQFQAAARFISTIDQMTDVLLSLV